MQKTKFITVLFLFSSELKATDLVINPPFRFHRTCASAIFEENMRSNNTPKAFGTNNCRFV